MSRIKDSLSLFIIVNAAALYIIYFVVKNLTDIALFAANLISHLISALAPLFIGLVVAYIISPLADFIDSKFTAKFTFTKQPDPIKKDRMLKNRYLVSIFISFFIILCALIALIYAFAALIAGTINVGSLQESASRIISYFKTLQEAALHAISTLPTAELRESAESLYSFVTSYFSRSMSGSTIVRFIANFGSSAIDFALGIVVSIYILKDKEFFHRMWRKLLHLTLPQKANAIVTETLHEISEVLSLFLRGASVDALIVSLLSSAALSVYGLDFSVFVGCFAGLVNIIPYFGPFIGMVPAFIVGMFTEGFAFGLGAALILLLIQQLDCNIIYPKIVGQSTGLHPLFVLLSVSVMGYYGGIVGMILAVPIAGIVKVLIMKFIPS